MHLNSFEGGHIKKGVILRNISDKFSYHVYVNWILWGEMSHSISETKISEIDLKNHTTYFVLDDLFLIWSL